MKMVLKFYITHIKKEGLLRNPSFFMHENYGIDSC